MIFTLSKAWNVAGKYMNINTWIEVYTGSTMPVIWFSHLYRGINTKTMDLCSQSAAKVSKIWPLDGTILHTVPLTQCKWLQKSKQVNDSGKRPSLCVPFLLEKSVHGHAWLRPPSLVLSRSAVWCVECETETRLEFESVFGSSEAPSSGDVVRLQITDQVMRLELHLWGRIALRFST